MGKSVEYDVEEYEEIMKQMNELCYVWGIDVTFTDEEPMEKLLIYAKEIDNIKNKMNDLLIAFSRGRIYKTSMEEGGELSQAKILKLFEKSQDYSFKDTNMDKTVLSKILKGERKGIIYWNIMLGILFGEKDMSKFFLNGKEIKHEKHEEYENLFNAYWLKMWESAMQEIFKDDSLDKGEIQKTFQSLCKQEKERKKKVIL